MSGAQDPLVAIAGAGDEAALRGAVQTAQAGIAAEFRGQTAVLDLAAHWSDVQRNAVAAAVRLVPDAAEMPWTWFVSGSVARGEAAPGSDVETMLVVGDDVDDAQKATMLLRAADVHATLERCGINGDANGVLASRPRFCRRLRSWSEGVTRWTEDPRQDRGVVMTGLMADSTSAVGNLDISGDALRAMTVAGVGKSSWARQALLQDATTLRAHFPSRLRAFATHADAVDLKLAAIDPTVKIARWAALAARSDATTTPLRIAAGAVGGTLVPDDASSLQECFEWLTWFRWRRRVAFFTDGRAASDVVSLAEVAPQDRAALRGVAREIAGISRRLGYLSTFR